MRKAFFLLLLLGFLRGPWSGKVKTGTKGSGRAMTASGVTFRGN